MSINNLTVEQYQAWKKDGLQDREILERLYYSPDNQEMLTNWKIKNGVPFKRKPRKNFKKKTDILTAEEFLKLRNQGNTNKEIADLLGFSKTTLNKWIRQQKALGNLPNRTLEKMEPLVRV